MKYQVCIPSYNGKGNFKELDAYDEEDAAKEYAKYYNENDGEYSLINNSISVLVREGDDGVIKIFSVSGEPDVYYSVGELDTPIICQGCQSDCTNSILAGKEMYSNFCTFSCQNNYYLKKMESK